MQLYDIFNNIHYQEKDELAIPHLMNMCKDAKTKNEKFASNSLLGICYNDIVL